MKKIEKFNLPEHTSKLYEIEAMSSISLSKEVADKINEIIEYLNTFENLDLEWKQDIEGRIAKGVVFMKDNLINSLHELLEILKASGYIDDKIEEYSGYIKQRLNNLLGLITEGSTTMDAEIIDGRTDGKGHLKPNLGENIRDAFRLLYNHLNVKLLEDISFYDKFSNVSYSNDPAYNRLGNEKPFNLDCDILAVAPKGYKVAVTVWDGDNKLGDTGWQDKVVIPKGFATKLGIKKESDGPISIHEVQNIHFEVEHIDIKEFNVSDSLEYTSGGFYSNIRLCAKYVTPVKPVTITCTPNHNVSAKCYRVDSGSRVFQRDTGWKSSVTLQPGLEYEINFKRADNSAILRSDLKEINFTTHNIDIELNENIKSICHRGYNVGAPENTLIAFRLAKKVGFKYVECDVSFTSDNVPVLLHDNTVDRTSNGSGAISSMTYEEASALDFGSWFSEEYEGEKIPTFEEFIILCRNLGLHPYIEIKYGATQLQVEKLVDIVARHGMKGKVTYISFEVNLLSYVFNKDKNARLGFICNTFTDSNLQSVKHLNANNNLFIDLNVSNVTEDYVMRCVSNDLPMEVWSVNNASNILNADTYISGFTTDYVLTECLFKEA